MSYQKEAATRQEVAAKTSTQTGANSHSSVWYGHYGEAALRLARDGWKVLPLRVRGKEPLRRLAPHGANSATSNPETIRWWWKQQPKANIGIQIPPGAIVLDLDPRNARTSDASPATLRELYTQVESALDELPDALTAITGGAGAHMWFTDPTPGLPLAGNVPGVPGAEVRTHPRYVVAPGSIHPNGNMYSWVEYPQVAEELPHTARECLTPRYEPVNIQQRATMGQARGFTRYVDVAMSDVRPGNRNATLFRLACKATQEGHAEQVFDMLRSRFMQAGLSLGEINQTIVSACRYIVTKAGGGQ